MPDAHWVTHETGPNFPSWVTHAGRYAGASWSHVMPDSTSVISPRSKPVNRYSCLRPLPACGSMGLESVPRSPGRRQRSSSRFFCIASVSGVHCRDEGAGLPRHRCYPSLRTSSANCHRPSLLEVWAASCNFTRRTGRGGPIPSFGPSMRARFGPAVVLPSDIDAEPEIHVIRKPAVVAAGFHLLRPFSSLVVGRESSHSRMSSGRQRTAEIPIFIGGGNRSTCISR